MSVTYNTAQVQIENQTGRSIRSVKVLHKYSNVYQNRLEFTGILQPGETILMNETVEYNTGFLTTGCDWWFVLFQMEDGSVYQSNPQNFRGIVDMAERFGQEVIRDGPTALENAAYHIAGAILNSESTVGFKKHTLRAEDRHVNTIVIKKDKIIFQSQSGNSETSVMRV